MPKSPLKVPAVVTAKGKATSAEVVPFQRLQVSEQDVMGPNGHVDPTQLVRLLNTIQDNHEQATLASRSDRSLIKKTVEGIQLTGTSGSPVQSKPIYHGLGRAFVGYKDVRAYAGGAPFSAVEAAKNGGQDPAQYLVLLSSCTGEYDLEIW